MSIPTLDELYKQPEYLCYCPDIPRINVMQYREGYSRIGAVAMSLYEWNGHGELQIGDDILRMLRIGGIQEGDEIEIDDVRLLAFNRDYARRSWIFLDATQRENHERFMWRLSLESELTSKFALIWIMQEQAEILFPDIATNGIML